MSIICASVWKCIVHQGTHTVTAHHFNKGKNEEKLQNVTFLQANTAFTLYSALFFLFLRCFVPSVVHLNKCYDVGRDRDQ